MSEYNPVEPMPHIEVAKQVSNYFAKTLNLGYNYFSAGMFNYGSLVYGNKKPTDIDVIAIYKGQHDCCEQYIIPNINKGESAIEITLYSEKTFLEKALACDISVLECVFAEKHNKLVEFSYFLDTHLRNLEIDKPTLRAAISKKSSNSYVKAKKKLIIEEDFNLECSIKSLWHSLRILEFGTQIADEGSIVDFKAINWLYPQVIEAYINANCNWDEIHKELKPLYNEAASAFKESCPKE